MPRQPLMVCIVGPSGVGKTNTVTAKLKSHYPNSYIVTTDNFYADHSDKTPEQKAQLDYDIPSALRESAIILTAKGLKQGDTVGLPGPYNFASHTPAPPEQNIPINGSDFDIIFFEGNMLQRNEEMRRLFHFNLYVDASTFTCFARRAQRDLTPAAEGGRDRPLEQTLTQYLNTVHNGYKAHIRPAKKYANLVLINEQNGEEPDLSKAYATIDKFLAKREELAFSTNFTADFIEQVCPQGIATQVSGETWKQSQLDKVIEPRVIRNSKMSLS